MNSSINKCASGSMQRLKVVLGCNVKNDDITYCFSVLRSIKEKSFTYIINK